MLDMFLSQSHSAVWWDDAATDGANELRATEPEISGIPMNGFKLP